MEKAPGVRRDGFEVAALSFGIQRPERERRLSRSGHAGEDNKGVAGNLKRDVLEVMFAGSADLNEAAVGFRVRSGPAADQRLFHPDLLAAQRAAAASIRKVFVE